MNFFINYMRVTRLERPWVFRIVCGVTTFAVAIFLIKIEVVPTIFKGFHTNHPWFFAIVTSAIPTVIDRLYQSFFNGIKVQSSNEQSVVKKEIKYTGENLFLTGCNNKGNIFKGANTVTITGDDNKNIVAIFCNTIVIKGNENEVYIINCGCIKVSGCANTIYLVGNNNGTNEIFGIDNVIRNMTHDEFNMLR